MAQLILYPQPGFQGNPRNVFHDEPSLGNFDNRTSSFKIVAGRWQFFADAHFGHKIGEFGPGKYDSAAVKGSSSVKLVG